MLALTLGALVSELGAQTYTFSNFASLYSNTGIAVDAGGNVYATAFYNHTILKISPTGSVTTLAGLAPTSGSADGVGNAARFTNPRAVALDAAGNLYVADTGNHAIRKVTPAGVVTTFAGLAGARGWEDGAAGVARFDSPQGIAVDAAGNVYVADTGTRTIRKITPDGMVITFAGLGYVSGAANGTGLDARFDSPQGIAVAPNNDLYVADTGNHAIRKITPSGATTLVAGSPSNRGAADGPGNVARFDSPQALAVDGAGNVFVADTSNYAIRKISPAALVTTVGGSFGANGDTAGTGAVARFNQARGIAVTSTGSLYIADSYNVKLGTPSNALAITVSPRDQVAASGSTVTFRVTATGEEPITYQWQKNGTAITGATAGTLTLTSIQASDSASYTLTARNSVGTSTTVPALLTVLSALANDNFANAQTIAGTTGQVTGNNNGATGELTEPTHINPVATSSSVWYRWTPIESGTAIFSVSSTFPALSAVYTGTALENLTRLPQSSANQPAFRAIAGTTYFIALGSSTPSQRGNFTLSWRMILNDAFAQAQEISGDFGQVAGNNNGATGEPSEPSHSSGTSATSTSVWFRWTAPRTGVASFDFSGSTFPLTLAAYTGNSLTTLTRAPIATVGPNLDFVVAAGTTYQIAVGSTGYSTGAFSMHWAIVDNPIMVSQTGGGLFPVGATATLTVTGMSPLPLTYQWFRDGVAIPNATNATLTLPNLQPSDAGTYLGRITDTRNAFVVSSLPPVVVLVPPPNDHFRNAQTVSGLSGSTTGSNVNATGEPDEPAHWNSGGSASSVWYRWTLDTSGLAIIDTVGSTFDTVLAVYTGTTLNALTRIVQDDDRGGGRTSQVSFAAAAGTTYFIAVGGSYAGARGSIALNWQLSPTLAIATPPASQTIAIGGSATFSVQATGAGVSYQWRRNGEIIPGATNSTLTVANVQGGSDAAYTVTITNSAGSVTSAPATLAVAAPALTALELRNTRNGGSLLWSIAANQDTLVAVGDAGAIISSLDNGRTWTPRASGTTAWLVGATYGAGQFVVVGDRGLVLTSTDGVTWTQSASGSTQRLNNVIYADGRFVAVGEGGTVLTSTDARVWTARISGTTNWLHGLAYNAHIGHFAASGQGGIFLYSADGVMWNTLPIRGLTADLEATVAVDSYAQFVAIGQDGVVAAVHQDRLVLKTGETVISWSGEFSNTGTSVRLRGLAQGASALFATGEDGKVITATDHRGPWYTVSSGTTGNLLAGLYHNNALFIVGENETALQSGALFGSRLINISTRGQVGTGSNLMISGFVITGDRPKQVLVRAAGPTLAASFGVSGTLSAPVLTLVDTQNRTVGANTGWLNSPDAATITTTAARVGAFPFAANSSDSALLATLSPGAYTALISGANNTTGVSIVEVYDTETLSNEGSRAINISTRGLAGSGDNKLIAGFVINGASSRRVLIRAVGPTIGAAPFNVGGSLAEPQIELYNSRNLLHATAGAWGLQANADEIRGVARVVGAFDLPDGSKDSAMVLTLLPGAWTVQVGGAGNSTGVVLVEVYALP